MTNDFQPRGVSGGGRYGIYGSTWPARHMPSVSQGGRSGGLLVAENTNSYVSFGNSAKRERNIHRTRGVFRTNISPVFRHAHTPGGSGQKVEYMYPAPSVQAYIHLKDGGYQGTAKAQRSGWAQTADMLIFANRVNANRMHSALIRPAAPAQVNWKTSYIVGQRNVQPIGPYQSLQQKSIIERVGSFVQAQGRG